MARREQLSLSCVGASRSGCGNRISWSNVVYPVPAALRYSIRRLNLVQPSASGIYCCCCRTCHSDKSTRSIRRQKASEPATLAQPTATCRESLTHHHRHADNEPLQLPLSPYGRQSVGLYFQQYSFHQASGWQMSPDGMYTYHTQTNSPRLTVTKYR